MADLETRLARAMRDPVNREGLTWEQWRNAARFAAPHTCINPGLIKAWRKLWRTGVDPAEMAHQDAGY